MIAQILERREHVVSKSVARQDCLGAIDVGNREASEPILQLEHDSLGRLATDAGNAGQAGDVAALNGCDEIARLMTDGCGMHVVDRTDAFTLVGGDARKGKVTLFAAEGPRERGVLEQIVVRVPRLDEARRLLVEAGYAVDGDGHELVELVDDLAQ